MVSSRAIALAVVLFALLAASCRAAGSSDTETADNFVKLTPRFYGPSRFDDNDVQGWIIGIAIYAAIGVGLAAISLLMLIICCSCRLCMACCRCCMRCMGGDNKPKRYTLNQKWIPFGFLAFFALVVAAFAAMGEHSNTGLNNAVLEDSDSIRSTIYKTVDDGIARAQEISDIVLQMINNLPVTVTDTTRILDATLAGTSSGTTGIVTTIRGCITTVNNVSNHMNAPSGITYTCVFCGPAATNLNNGLGEVNTQLNSSFATFRTTLNDVNSQLIQKSTDISNQLTDANNQANEIIDDARSRKEQYRRDVDEQIDKYNNIRYPITYMIFIFPFSCIVLVIVGVVLKNAIPFRINYWVGFFTLIFMWLLFAVHMPLALAMADLCVEGQIQETKFLTKANPSKTDKILRSCYYSTSLLDALDLRDDLNFSRVINFINAQAVDVDQRFASLTSVLSFSTSVNGLTPFMLTGGQFLESSITDPLDTINGYGVGVFTADNIESFNPNTAPDPPTALALKNDVIKFRNDKRFLEQKINEIKLQNDILNNQTAVLKGVLTRAKNNITSIASLVNPYIALANQLEAKASCDFAGNNYRQMKHAVCTNVVTYLSLLAMAYFFIGISTPFTICLSQSAADRIPAQTRDAGDDPDKVEMSGAGQPLMAPSTSSQGNLNLGNSSVFMSSPSIASSKNVDPSAPPARVQPIEPLPMSAPLPEILSMYNQSPHSPVSFGPSSPHTQGEEGQGK